MTDPLTAAWAEHRNLLFTVAYELLGSAADAEDVLQETWLRVAELDPARIRDPRAYLVRTATRQSLNRMRTLARRRESYVGPWLPEPLLTTPDVAEDVELAESVSTAMLLVLETLGPIERAVFVLREVFGYSYAEIAEAVERTPVAVRQIAHRAREHVAARRPRTRVSAAEAESALQRFVAAAATGDLQALLDVLAPDVVLRTDGGGIKSAARRPILGADKVARFLIGVQQRDAEITADQVTVNGAPAIRIYLDGELDSVLSARVAADRIDEIFFLRNPEKLGYVAGRPTDAIGLTR